VIQQKAAYDSAPSDGRWARMRRGSYFDYAAACIQDAAKKAFA
jgi:hypothetical protein